LIFSSQEDLGKFNLDHALSVDFDSCFNLADTRILDQFNGRRVMIEGRYHSSSMATNGAAAGELGSPQKLLIGNMSISCVDGKIRGL
jgi:hypothetical protein